MRRFRSGIQDRIVIWMLVLGILPAVITALLGHWVMSSAEVDSTGRYLMSVGADLARDVDVVLRELTGDVGELATHSEPVRLLVESANTRYTGLDSAAVAGIIAAETTRWNASPDRAGRDLTYNRASGELKRFRQRNPDLYDRLLITDSMGLVFGATKQPGSIYSADQSLSLIHI